LDILLKNSMDQSKINPVYDTYFIYSEAIKFGIKKRLINTKRLVILKRSDDVLIGDEHIVLNPEKESLMKSFERFYKIVEDIYIPIDIFNNFIYWSS